MEVHHHPEVEKKGFKEYFFEGIMIFLAVMMGYLAESARGLDKGQVGARSGATIDADFSDFAHFFRWFMTEGHVHGAYGSVKAAAGKYPAVHSR